MYAKSIQQISVLNPANAFILLNLSVARENFVEEGLNAKNASLSILRGS